jgi:putative hydrolase of the HAD superfamily
MIRARQYRTERGTSNMRGTKAALFDLYDTLTYSDELRYREKIVRCAAVCEVTPSEFSKAWRSIYVQSTLGVYPETEDRVKAVLDILGIRRSEEVIRKVTDSEHEFLRTSMILFRDARNTLVALKAAGMKLALVTNASPSVRVLIRAHKLDEYFDTIIVSSEINCRKPAERIYKAAFEQLEVKPCECVFVGDGNDNELEGAQKLGTTTIWIKRGLPKYQKGENPTAGFDFTAESLDEVRRLIMTIISIGNVLILIDWHLHLLPFPHG